MQLNHFLPTLARLLTRAERLLADRRAIEAELVLRRALKLVRAVQPNAAILLVATEGDHVHYIWERTATRCYETVNFGVTLATVETVERYAEHTTIRRPSTPEQPVNESMER